MSQDLWQKLGYNFSDPTAAWLTEGDKEFAELVHEVDFSRCWSDHFGRDWRLLWQILDENTFLKNVECCELSKFHRISG